jgi:Phospholipase A2-like domain
MYSTVKRGGGGSGSWITDAIEKVPIELHLPGYNFCGPNTKLEQRLARGDTGINPLDKACLDHDISYARSKDSKVRHAADRVLADKAWSRVKSSDARLGERLAALLVTGAMKAKVKLGGGLQLNKKRKNKSYGAKGKIRKSSSCSKTLDENQLLRGVKKAVKNSKSRNIVDASKVAFVAAKRLAKGKRIKKQTTRIIPIPKTGGVLPFLVPLFAGLSATGALAGGASAVAKAVNAAAEARKSLNEMKRHNEKMEAIALGNNNNSSSGSGFYLRPYKSGYGLVVKSKN